MQAVRRPRVGLVLGSGAARGWAHIGVLRTLTAAGIRPDLVCGTSIGALVGASYAAGQIERLDDWVLSMGVKQVWSLMDFRLSGGVFKGERLMRYFSEQLAPGPIEHLNVPFGAVATAMATGTEVWLRSGPTVDAVRASIALPGMFTPVLQDGRWLVDGALVNPVPVSLARAMGADIVIAVDLNTDFARRQLTAQVPLNTPSMLEVITSSINVMQSRIARSRMAGEPPEVVINPRLGDIGLLDFHRGAEAIAHGERAAAVVLPALKELGLGHSPPSP
jgi:NTE family protein